MILMEEMIAVLLGGALGSLLRFLVSRWVNELMHKGFPWGILTVNVLGSFIMGIAAGLFLSTNMVGPFWRSAVLVGFLGGFTTFSSFSIDTVNLFQSGQFIAATANIVVTVFCCLGATLIGLMISKVILG